MKLSKPKSTQQQLTFWDEPLGNHGHVRTIIGDFAEVLTAKFLNGVRYKTDSTADYSPDVVANGIYYEVKAAGLSNQTFIYSGRVMKDRAFAATHDLYYTIWHHSVPTLKAKTVYHLQAMMLSKLRALYIVPWESIDLIIGQLREEKLNSKYGKHSNPGCYGSGYRLNISSLRQFQFLSFER